MTCRSRRPDADVGYSEAFWGAVSAGGRKDKSMCSIFMTLLISRKKKS